MAGFFQISCCPPSWIIRNLDFHLSAECGVALCITVQNYIEIASALAEPEQFQISQNCGHPTSWISKNQIFIFVRRVRTGAVHHRAKFHRDSLNGCGDIAIFRVAVVRHLGF